MGKTFIQLLEVAAIIAVQFIPGVGQALGAALAVSAAAGTAIAAVAVIGLETILNATLLAPKSQKPTTTESPLKSAIPPRVSAYGRVRLQGAYILFETASNGSAIDVWAFHEGRIDAIEQYYLGNTKVSLDNGWVQADDSGNGQFGDNTPGQGGGVVRIGANLGQTPGTAFPLVISLVPDHWTTNHRGDGVVTGYMISRAVKSKNYQRVYASGGPNQTPMSLAMRAQLVFDWRDPSQSVTNPASWKWSENAVLHLAHYLLVRMNRDWSLYFVPTLAYWTAAANDADAAMPLTGVQTALRVKASPGDTKAYLLTLNGLHVGMSIDIAVSGDNTKTETRTITSIDTGLVTASWSGGLSYLHPQGSEVDWISQAGSPATEARYRSCVAHSHTDAHKDVLSHLIACFDGFLSPRADGALVVYSGRYTAPTVSIGPDEIVSYTFQQFVAEESAINTIKVSYVSQNHDFNTVQADDWTDEDDIEARGKILSEGLDNQVPSYTQARRLAKRALSKAMPASRGTCTVTADGRDVVGQRYINLDLNEAGAEFINGPVEVVKITRNLQTGGLTFDWIAADPNIDAWNPATEDGNPAPIGNRIGTQPLMVPVITAATPDYSAVSDDGTGVRINLTVAGLNRDDVSWFARWRVQGAAVWAESEYTDIDAGASVTLLTGFVPTGQTIEVEAAYKVGDGRISDYSAATTVSTATDLTVPDAAIVPVLENWSNTLDLAINPIARARNYIWRFYDGATNALIATYTTTVPTVSYSATQAAIDGVRRNYKVKVSGANGAGEGVAAITAAFSHPAPAAATTPAISGGATTATATCDVAVDASGYAVFYSNTSGFDPATQGGFVVSGLPSIQIFGLAAGTYYGRIAAFDSWSSDPTLLNLSSEKTFTITTGGGTTPSGGGTGGGGHAGAGRANLA